MRSITLNLIFFALALTGCAHTRIAAREVPPEGQKLASLSGRSVTFNVQCPIDEIVGHQYLLLVFPFGRISLEDPARHLSNQLIVALAERGYRALPSSLENAAVVVTCEEMSLTAYDYLFLRQIVAKISWTLWSPDSFDGGERMPRDSSRKTALKAFAFYSQLEHLWHQSLADAAGKISHSPIWERPLAAQRRR